jgi:hypothetical protein
MNLIKIKTVQVRRQHGLPLTLNYSEYRRNNNEGIDSVLQLKGYRELSHITIHPNGVVNIHERFGRDSELCVLLKLGFPGVDYLPVEMVEFVKKLKELKPELFF